MVNRRSLNRMVADNPDGGGTSSKRRQRQVHHYGPVQGEEVGKIYRSRESMRNIHRPERNWIHLGPEGPYSLIIQRTSRFCDGGTLFIILTKESPTSRKKSANNTVLGNLKKGIKGRLPIRVLRHIKTDHNGKPVFRYDGLYLMKKKILFEDKKIHFLLQRAKDQPKLLMSKQVYAYNKIKRVISLAMKKRNKEIKKEEIEIKSEVASNSDTEKDSIDQTVELTIEQLKQEYASLREESTYDYEDGGYEVWQKGGFPIFVKTDTDEIYEGHTSLDCDEEVDKFEMYYEDQGTVLELNNEDIEHFSKEDVIYERISFPKTEDGDSNDNLETLLAYVSEKRTSEYEFVKENSVRNFNPPCDPLGSFSDESKTSDCNDEINEINTTCDGINDNCSNEVNNSCSGEINNSFSDEINNTSQEVKTSDDEKKSGQLYSSECENIKCSDKHNFLSMMEHSHNPCLYDLTIRHLIYLLGNRADNSICPCRSSPKCASQKNLELAFQSQLNEARLRTCDPKCLKGNKENTEIKDSSTLSNLYDWLTDVIYNRKSDVRTPINNVVQKQQQIITNEKHKNYDTNDKNCHSKQIPSVEESLVSSSVEESSVTSSVEESLVSSNVKDSSVSSSVKESFVHSEVHPCTNPAYRATSPLPEDTSIRLTYDVNNCEEDPKKIHDPNNVNKRRGRRKGSKNFETSQLGPMISTEEESVPKEAAFKRSYKGSSFYVSPRHSLSRSASRKRVQEEEEDKFLGFIGPIRPSRKLRLIGCYLARLKDYNNHQQSQL